MANKIVYPSLSEDGWVSSGIKIGDNLFSCFLISDYSQSYIYSGLISSFPWILQETQNDMSRTISLTQQTLSDYFSRYFNNVIVEVMEIDNLTDPSKGQISIYVKYSDSDNKEYVLGKMLEIADLTVKKIIDINNG